jgi:hypothetical protein
VACARSPSLVQTGHDYYWGAISENPAHFVVVGARSLLLSANVGVCFLELSSPVLLLILGMFQAAQCVLMHFHAHRFALEAHRAHPMGELPTALLSLQQRRKREIQEENQRQAMGTAGALNSSPQKAGAPAGGPVRSTTNKPSEGNGEMTLAEWRAAKAAEKKREREANMAAAGDNSAKLPPTVTV